VVPRTHNSDAKSSGDVITPILKGVSVYMMNPVLSFVLPISFMLFYLVLIKLGLLWLMYRFLFLGIYQ